MGKAQAKYKAKSVIKIYVEFNRNTDPDLIAWLNDAEKDGGRNNAIKHAIRVYLAEFQPHYAKERIISPAYDEGADVSPAQVETDAVSPAYDEGADVSPAQVETDAVSPAYDGGADVSPAQVETDAVSPAYDEGADVSPAQVKTEILKKAKTYAGKGETYLINYVLKKGRQELQREAIIRGYNKKGAIQNFRKWHEETKEGGEGHAFRPTATRKWGKNGLDPLTTPEAEAIPQIYGESAEQWKQDTENFWRKVDEEIAANARKEK